MTKKINCKLILRVIVSFTLFGWLFCSLDWERTWTALKEINRYWLSGAALWVALAVGVSVVKWRIILLAQGIRTGWRELWNAYWIGLFFNNFLPSSIGGDAMRAFLIGKSAGDTPGVTFSVVVERILATLGLALVGLGASFQTGENPLNVRAFFLLIGLGGILFTVILIGGRVPGFLKGRNGKIASFAGSFINQGKLLGNKPGVILQVIIWSIVFQMINVAVNYSLFRGLGISQVTLIEAMLLIPATAAASMLPLGINGYGIREGAYVMLLTPFGVDRTLAFTASILYAFLVSLCSLWGGMLWLRLNKKGEGNYAGTRSV